MLNIRYTHIGVTAEEDQDYSRENYAFFDRKSASSGWPWANRSRIFNTDWDSRFFSNHFCHPDYMYDFCLKSYLFKGEDCNVNYFTKIKWEDENSR